MSKILLIHVGSREYGNHSHYLAQNCSISRTSRPVPTKLVLDCRQFAVSTLDCLKVNVDIAVTSLYYQIPFPRFYSRLELGIIGFQLKLVGGLVFP